MIAIVGAGKMGEALLAGFLHSGYAPDEVLVTEPRREHALELQQQFGVEPVDVRTAAHRAETLVLAVKPQDIAALLDELADVVGPHHLVISVAAGVTTTVVEKHLGGDVAVIRAMPNTPALRGVGMTALAGGTQATDEALDRAEQMLCTIGDVIRVQERHMDTVTAISGSGPAYVYFVAETMVEAGVAMGMPRDIAQRLVSQTITGAAEMLAESGEHPVMLREAVTSPGGTTAAAVRELERDGVRAAFTNAIEAARDRSRQLSEG